MTAAESQVAVASASQIARIGFPQDRHGNAQQGSAWQKEMERAQLASWFKPGTTVLGASFESPSATVARQPQEVRSAANVGETVVRGVTRSMGVHMESSSIASAPNTAPTHTAYGEPSFAVRSVRTSEKGGSQRGETSESMPITAVYVGEPSTHGFAYRQMRQNGELPATPSGTSAREPATPQDQGITNMPFRIHMESQRDKVSIWVAVSGAESDAIAELPKVLNDIQKWLISSGKAIHEVFCNGKLLWRTESEKSEFNETASGEETSINEQRPTGLVAGYGSQQNRIFTWEVPHGR